MNKYMRKLIMTLYKMAFGKLRRMIERYVMNKENGEFWSETLRHIYKTTYGIEIGMGSYGCFDSSRFPKGTVVGNYCSIAGEVRYLNANHPKQFVSTHPMFYNKMLGFVNDNKIIKSNLNIGNDVWIGYASIIVSSCTRIGDGSIIASGSVVTRDVEPYTINAGVPAKVIGKRFSDEIEKAIRETEWYKLSPQELTDYIDYFASPMRFIEEWNKKY